MTEIQTTTGLRAPAKRLTPAHRARQRGLFDALILGGAVFVIGMSMLLTPSDHYLHLFGIRIPTLCTFKLLTGYDCPGCGLSRSFTYMGHGRIADAFRMHKLGPLMWTFTALQIPWRSVALLRIRLRH